MFLFAFVTLGTAQLVGFLCAHFCCSNEWIPLDDKTSNSSKSSSSEQDDASNEGGSSFLWKKLRQAITTPSPKDYQPLYLITMGTQNTGNFPLGLLVSLVGNISWYDTAAYNESLSVVFVYAALWTIFIWSIGLWTVRSGAKRRRIAHQKLQNANGENDRLTVEVAAVEALRHLASMDDLALATRRDEQQQQQQQQQDDEEDVVSVVRQVTHEMFEVNCSITTLDLIQHITPTAAPGFATTGVESVVVTAALPPTIPRHVVVAQALSRLNLPVAGSILGIVIALVPPLRWLFYTPGGIGLIGDGCVPLSLLILGANLTAGGLKPLLKIDPRYLLVGTFVKTIILPAINVALFFMCDYVGLLPEDRVLRIAVWVEIISPSPVMATVICRLEDYMAECATGLLLLQYIVATFTTTAWLSIFLLMYPS
ncbi:membrane transporter, putative [Bodo saltans]|uniref:Membrane transporter, putative n=1 Tax=Bodo saltans TaxID=75058 RepID=A0A0S4J2X2_BODSA|nr:membrane transporter, putative [Bodo saltans]|eukprot:CUG85536.1 membrane transporter, putative [Bodo saltans]